MTDDLTPQGAAAVRLAATVVQLKAERDRARGIAVALEQRLARVERLDEHWLDEAADHLECAEGFEADGDHERAHDHLRSANQLARLSTKLRRALEADQ